ncbi:MAG: SDR family oxidoreductase [Pseudomonadales bacterium]|nr:SDR family oxidoreductase [Pseudomonadales bacterium]
MGRLDGKVAVITGGAGGIGSVAARRFVAEGAQVLLVDLDQTTLDSEIEDIDSNQISGFAADVTSAVDSEAFIEVAVERYGGIDILLANAGIEGDVSPMMEYSEKTFDKVMAVNVKGVWLSMKYAFAAFQKRGGGSIIITSSTTGIKGTSRLCAYSTSKHAVIGLMRNAALEGAVDNIRVNCVNPSPTETLMMRRLEVGIIPDSQAAAHDAIASSIPLARYGQPEDIANLMLFLSSDESKFLTGGVYMADGGVSAT